MKDFELLKMDPFYSLDWVFRLILNCLFYSFGLTAQKSSTAEPVPLAIQPHRQIICWYSNIVQTMRNHSGLPKMSFGLANHKLSQLQILQLYIGSLCEQKLYQIHFTTTALA